MVYPLRLYTTEPEEDHLDRLRHRAAHQRESVGELGMTHNLIETVAQAMHGNRYEWPRPEFAEHREEYRKMAKAAILATLKAIREPSGGMVSAACRATVQGDGLRTIAAQWEAMVDALRAEIESAA
jgi:hypothetical protein